MKSFLGILFLCFTCHVQSQTMIFENIVYDSISGVDEELLALDVYIPEGDGPKPVAIYVHGGGWCIGDKSNVHEKANLLNDLGYIFISINYRLSPFPYELENDDRIQYPDHPKDVAKAISFILDRVGEFNGDLDNVFLFGHSSGAHLVATVLTDQSFLAPYGYSPADFKCACILDTGGFDLGFWIEESATDPNLFINAFSSDQVIWQQASPILHIQEEEELPDMLLVYQDNVRRIIANQNFGQTLTQNTDALVTNLSTSFDHQQINQSLGSIETPEEEAYTLQFTEWLEGCMMTTTSTIELVGDGDQNLVSYSLGSGELTLLTDKSIYLYSVNGELVSEIHGRVGDAWVVDQSFLGLYFVTDGLGRVQKIMILN